MATDYTLTSSGLKTADGVINARNCRLHTVTLITDGTNAASAVLYDNASAASGNVVAKLACAGADQMQFIHSDIGVECANGIYLDITGTGAGCVITYSDL